MLLLSRKRNETIIIAPGTPYETILTIVDIRGDKARIGIHCSKGIPVHRMEVWEAIQREEAKGNRKID